MTYAVIAGLTGNPVVVQTADLLLLSLLLLLKPLTVKDDLLRHDCGSRCIRTIEYMILERSKLHCSMQSGCGCAADKQRNVHAPGSHLAA